MRLKLFKNFNQKSGPLSQKQYQDSTDKVKLGSEDNLNSKIIDIRAYQGIINPWLTQIEEVSEKTTPEVSSLQ